MTKNRLENLFKMLIPEGAFSSLGFAIRVSASPTSEVGGEGSVWNWGLVDSHRVFGEHRDRKILGATAMKGFPFPDKLLYPEFQVLRLFLVDLCFSQVLGELNDERIVLGLFRVKV